MDILLLAAESEEPPPAVDVYDVDGRVLANDVLRLFYEHWAAPLFHNVSTVARGFGVLSKQAELFIPLPGDVRREALPVVLASVTQQTAHVMERVNERTCLISLYHSTNGDNWNRNTHWCSDKVHSKWHGVTVDDEVRVTKLYLGGNQLVGNLRKELGQLALLTHLSLCFNHLTGTIPQELGQLAALRALSLNDNQLTGSIPKELGQLASLTNLSLNDNQLKGSIPKELGQLASLICLDLRNNQLTVTLEEELALKAELPKCAMKMGCFHV